MNVDWFAAGAEGGGGGEEESVKTCADVYLAAYREGDEEEEGEGDHSETAEEIDARISQLDSLIESEENASDKLQLYLDIASLHLSKSARSTKDKQHIKTEKNKLMITIFYSCNFC